MSGILNPLRNTIIDVRALDKQPTTAPPERVACILYRWLENTVRTLQADFARDGKTEHKERALLIWKLILNCISPLADEARGKGYAAHYNALGDQLRDLAVRGQTPAGIIAEVQKQLDAGPRLEYLSRTSKPPILPQNLPLRRAQVASLMGEGLTDREIGEHLGIKMSTVQMHVRHVLSYTHSPNRTVAVRRLVESGEMSRLKKVA